MSDHAGDLQKHLKIYIGVFVALLVLTVLTVLASYIDLSTKGNVALALIIAAFKATLVAGYFMHLNSEKSTIYRFLAVTVVFFLGLMFLSLFAFYDPVTHTPIVSKL